MNAHKANLINVLTLIFMSGWGYLDALTPSMSTLFPMYFAIILLAMNDGIKYNNMAQSRVAIVLSIIILAILVNPFRDAMVDENQMAMFRSGAMMVTTTVAIIYLVKSVFKIGLAKPNKK